MWLRYMIGRTPIIISRISLPCPEERALGARVRADTISPADESTAVIGIMLEVNADQTLSSFFTDALGRVEAVPNASDITVTGPLVFEDVGALVQDSDIYRYDGSLTTPPCTEGVGWNVVRDPAFISAETYAAAKAVLGFNARYTQNSLGERNLLRHAVETVVDVEG